MPLVFVLSCISGTTAQTIDETRVKFTINDGWKFLRENGEQAESSNFDDSLWQKVNLPHSWNVEDTRDDEPGYYRGIGWYRKKLSLSSNLRNRRIFLYFEGANQVAEVFVNGEKVGEHIGGYTAFGFDVTEKVKFGEENLIAVKVDNKHDETIPPLDADFAFYGGIYRDVWLIAANDAHFSFEKTGAFGVNVETPKVSNESADVKVLGKISNDSGKTKNLEIVSKIFDKSGKSVSQTKTKLQVGARSERDFKISHEPVKNPELWSPDAPNLYSVRTQIMENGKITDEIVSPLGFRWFLFDANKGFFLNGKHLKLRGTNRHQDFEGMANAVPDSIHIRDLEMIKEDGFNFVRLAHYPQDPSVLAAADRLGLLIWEEIPIVNLIPDSAEFNENSKRMAREMIAQHRNHPSIIMWGYMNEIFLRQKDDANLIKKTVELAREIEKICRAEDPSRFTTMAIDRNNKNTYETSGIINVPQVIGWNLYHGWYYEKFEDFGKFMDEKRRRNPNIPFLISEYGSGSDERIHSLKPKSFDFSVEWQQLYHESYIAQIDEREYIGGSAIWNQFNFGSEFRGDSIPHINQKGLYTFDRKPKDISYFYKAKFSKTPVLHIASTEWTRRSASGTNLHPLKIYTNLSEIELFQNGVSLGRKKIDDSRILNLEINFKNGWNSFTAKGNSSAGEITDELKIHFTNAKIDENFTEIAVNVGSKTQFIDKSTEIWLEDQPYKKGSWGFTGETAKTGGTSRNIENTEEDPLFQTMQKELSGYRFDVPDGVYELEMRFAEPEFKEIGKRVFDIFINGETVFENLDLVKQSGAFQPVVKKIIVEAKEQKGLFVEFKAKNNQTILSAIRVRKL